jgi:hypothetical protein
LDGSLDEKHNSELKNVPNVIVIQKANIKSGVGQHGPPTKAKVKLGVMEK